MKIVFVCNANIVRSFMAERVLKRLLNKRPAHGVEVSSAGLLDMQGAPADEKARQILRENGIDDEGHRSRLLTETMIDEADLVVTMEQEQLRKIVALYPHAVDKVRILKSFLPGQHHDETDGDVKDPYRGSVFQYRLCFAEISLAVGELIKCT